MSVVDTLVNGAKDEVKVVRSFIQSPAGVFETLDNVVKVARETAFGVERAVGIPRPVITGKLYGSGLSGAPVGSGDMLRKVRERVKTARTNLTSRMK